MALELESFGWVHIFPYVHMYIENVIGHCYHSSSHNGCKGIPPKALLMKVMGDKIQSPQQKVEANMRPQKFTQHNN